MADEAYSLVSSSSGGSSGSGGGSGVSGSGVSGSLADMMTCDYPFPITTTINTTPTTTNATTTTLNDNPTTTTTTVTPVESEYPTEITTYTTHQHTGRSSITSSNSTGSKITSNIVTKKYPFQPHHILRRGNAISGQNKNNNGGGDNYDDNNNPITTTTISNNDDEDNHIQTTIDSIRQDAYITTRLLLSSSYGSLTTAENWKGLGNYNNDDIYKSLKLNT